MRNFSVASRVVALVAVVSVSAVGQQPAQIVEPEHTQGELTLADAARTNNYPLFESLYAEAGDGTPAFAELRRFWKWSLEDPIGGFYGIEMHAKFAGEYPGYTEYIADYAIIDSNGNTFYPSAETRRFLLRQAMSGNAPRPVPVKVAKKVVRKVVKKAVKKFEGPAVAPPPVTQPAPPAIVRTPVVTPQPRGASGFSPPRRAEARPSTEAPSGNRVAPAIALLIAGLIGVGLLTLMLRTPAEEVPQPKEEEPMEPLRIIPLEEKPKKTA